MQIENRVTRRADGTKDSYYRYAPKVDLSTATQADFMFGESWRIIGARESAANTPARPSPSRAVGGGDDMAKPQSNKSAWACVTCGDKLPSPTSDPFRCENCRAVRVTDFRLDRVEIPEARYWDLPEATRRLIETYAVDGRIAINHGSMTFQLPIYRWQEIQASMRQLQE